MPIQKGGLDSFLKMGEFAKTNLGLFSEKKSLIKVSTPTCSTKTDPASASGFLIPQKTKCPKILF